MGDDCFGFSAGPVWIRRKGSEPGYLLAVSIIGNAIYKITPDGEVSVFMDEAGYTGDDYLHDGKFAYIARIRMLQRNRAGRCRGKRLTSRGSPGQPPGLVPVGSSLAFAMSRLIMA